MRLNALTCAVGLLVATVAAHAEERALPTTSSDGELRRVTLDSFTTAATACRFGATRRR